MIGRSRRAGATLALVVVLVGCEVRTTVSIRVDESGAGRVTVRVALDRDAWEQLEGPTGTLEETARLDDLSAAGWSVGEWERSSDGGGSILLRKLFVGGDELRAVLVELGGASLVESVDLTRDRGLVRDGDRLAIAVDLRQLATDLAGDEELAARLTAAGMDPNATGDEFDTQLARALRVDVIATVPGARDQLILRPGDRDELVVESSRYKGDRVLLSGLGAAVALLGVLLLLGAVVSMYQHRRRIRLAQARAAQVRRGRDEGPLM